jgi:hypothetical protein
VLEADQRGCQLDRNMDDLIRVAGFQINTMKTCPLASALTCGLRCGYFSLRWRAASSKSEIAQGRVIVRTATKRPVVAALAVSDWKIVDAGNTQPHQAVLGEFPILVAIAAEPVPAGVLLLIGETNRDAVLPDSPDLLNEPVVKLSLSPRRIALGFASGYPSCMRARCAGDRVCSTHPAPYGLSGSQFQV